MMKLARSGIMYPLLILGFSATVILGFNDAANAVPVVVTSRAGIAATDFIDWGVLGPSFTVVANPFSISSNGGSTSATLSMPTGSFERRDQGNGWAGNFAPGDPGDHVLWTEVANGPTIIKFTNPVAGAGAQIQRDLFGPFTATLDVFDPSNTLIGAFTLPGNSNSNGDNSAIFLGVTDNSADIGSIVYDTDTHDFGINQLSLNLSPVPEPSTLALITSGLPVLVFAMRKRVTKRKIE